MITEDYCSFEIAKLLKEKGFNDIPVYTYYLSYGGFYLAPMAVTNKDLYAHGHIAAPTHQMAMKWLREVHKLPINIWYDKEEDTPDDEVWNSEIAVDRPSYILVGSFASYEEACETALKYCLENLI